MDREVSGLLFYIDLLTNQRPTWRSVGRDVVTLLLGSRAHQPLRNDGPIGQPVDYHDAAVPNGPER